MKMEAGTFRSALQVQNEYLSQNTAKKAQLPADGKVSFRELLDEKAAYVPDAMEKLKFSKHANSRLADRKISLTDNQVQRLYEGAKRAQGKGISESLVLVDDLAFIVNVKSSTVITAMDQTQADENVFTNIDGAIIM